jgi:hypothetical protein
VSRRKQSFHRSESGGAAADPRQEDVHHPPAHAGVFRSGIAESPAGMADEETVDRDLDAAAHAARTR